MSGPTPAAEPPRRAGQGVWRAFDALVLALNALGTVGILLLMALINSDIAGRAVFNAPVRGATEIVALSIVAIVFLQMGYMLRSGRMIRSEGLLDRLRHRHPRIAAMGFRALALGGAVFFSLLLWASWPGFREAWIDNLFVGAEGDFTAPIWPVKLVILVGSAVMAVQYLRMALGQDAGPDGRAPG